MNSSKAVKLTFVLLLAESLLHDIGWSPQSAITLFKALTRKQLDSHGREKRSGVLQCPTPIEVDVVLSMNLPSNTEPSQIIDQLRMSVQKVVLLSNFSNDVMLTRLNLTTVCLSNSTEGQQCQCEEQYAWPCSFCDDFGACNNETTETCDCINGLPSNGQFCELQSLFASCQPPPPTPPTTTEVDIVLTFPDDADPSEFIDQLRMFGITLSLPENITNEVVLESLNLTTTCQPNSTEGQQCQCEGQYAWPCSFCDDFGACNNETTETCDCINGLPSNGQFCELQSLFASCQPPPPTPPTTTEVDIVLTFPDDADPSEFIDQLRMFGITLSLPENITNEVVLESLNLTTTCQPNSTEGQQCQCEGQYAWPCSFCDDFGACNNETTETCDCINGLPSNGQFCELQSLFASCQPPPPTPPTTTEVDIVLTFPDDADPSEFIDQLRMFGITLSLPENITNEVVLESLNLTTTCQPNSTEGQQCQCEGQYAWPCSFCDDFGACNNETTETCDCINGLPSNGQFCELQSLFATCQPPPPTPPTTTEVDIVLTFPDVADPSEFINQLRMFVITLSLPENITNEVVLESLNLTTTCQPNSTEGQQCQCEEQYAWPCSFCDDFGACNNETTETCDCINGLPSNGQFCELQSLFASCQPPPTTPPTTTEVDIVLTVNVPDNTDPSQFLNSLRIAVATLSLPQNIPDSLIRLDLTTTCFIMTAGVQQCRCEDQYTWPCQFCQSFGSCSNELTAICNCIDTLPPDGEFCELQTSDSICPANITTTFSPPPSTSSTISDSPPNPNPSLFVLPVSFTIDMNFDPEFNNINNFVNMRVNMSIMTLAPVHIPNLLSAELINFSAGSTIVNFNLIASEAIEDSNVDDLLIAIFNNLRDLFPLVLDSVEPLSFQPAEIFIEQTLTVICGPPPDDAEFNEPFTAEWSLNGEIIAEDAQHTISTDDRMSTLTILNFFFTDNGFYECQLIDNNGIFRQRSPEFMLNETPRIQVRPLETSNLCQVGQTVPVACSVQDPYIVEFDVATSFDQGPSIQYQHMITNCSETDFRVNCQVINFTEFSREIRLRFLTNVSFTCVNDPIFGNGLLNDTGRAVCQDEGDVGQMTAICRESGEWEDEEDNCTNQRIAELLLQSSQLTVSGLEDFLDGLNSTVVDLALEVAESPNDIEAIVRILNNVGIFVTTTVSNITTSLIVLNPSSIEDILSTTGVLTIEQAQESWDFLNARAVTEVLGTRIITPRNESISSLLLFSLESVTSRFINDTLNIETPLVLLNKTTFASNFGGDFNSTVEIDVSDTGAITTLTVLTFESMDNVLPPRDEDNSTGRAINGRVVLVQSDTTVNNITFVFDIINQMLRRPQCVFWNFTLFEGLGGWDDEGCTLIAMDSETVTCRCDHVTSFSMLMSPFVPAFPALAFITYIGVAVSLASLVICLIIEAVVWKKMKRNEIAYLRHISIVNIALSLLIANIWFIIGATIASQRRRNLDACVAATFFIHFFYLALFFWMLASALLLLYHAVNVFGTLTKQKRLAIGFCLGYGGPLIIASITIAVTAPTNTYIQITGACWLNWTQSRALLAFAVPALLIVFINIVILLVVATKLIQSHISTNDVSEDTRQSLKVIIRSLTVLTPFFGITWSLGVGTLIDPRNIGIHVTFALFNSLQGFFILVFGTLLDRKVRDAITEITRFGTTSNDTRRGRKINSQGQKVDTETTQPTDLTNSTTGIHSNFLSTTNAEASSMVPSREPSEGSNT
ncbi:adhesion G protein-coupled receptor F5-like [Entelurus aequoreus]|uniref:adhesion G protein-coupled receptor F5-like n=1 Tax=Entelurus aequoreus TaxID=161455 RepID=UPI002B1D4103|nr:adhesion G protein-coupled receptor F5-like [Entelurus aequoreus]